MMMAMRTMTMVTAMNNLFRSMLKQLQDFYTKKWAKNVGQWKLEKKIWFDAVDFSDLVKNILEFVEW